MRQNINSWIAMACVASVALGAGFVIVQFAGVEEVSFTTVSRAPFSVELEQ